MPIIGGAASGSGSNGGGDGDSGIAGDEEGEEARGNDENSADASKQEKERTAVEVSEPLQSTFAFAHKIVTPVTPISSAGEEGDRRSTGAE